MTTKRVLTIKDENYGETFEVSSKSGIFMHDNIIIIDTKELAQLCCERATFCDKNIPQSIIITALSPTNT